MGCGAGESVAGEEVSGVDLVADVGEGGISPPSRSETATGMMKPMDSRLFITEAFRT